MKKILVAVDGSEKAKKAAEKAAELAESLDAQATLIHVYNQSAKAPIDEFTIMDTHIERDNMLEIIERHEKSIVEEKKEILEQDAKVFEEKGINVEKIFRYGDAADVVCEYAEENAFDLIVVADKGHSKIGRFLLGSISDKIVRHSKISVMVVK